MGQGILIQIKALIVKGAAAVLGLIAAAYKGVDSRKPFQEIREILAPW